MTDADAAVLTQDRGPVRVLLFNRPNRRNALDGHIRRELVVALEEAGTTDSVRAVVLAGVGGVFCAGGDLTSMRRQGIEESRPRLEAAQAVARGITDCPRPVIAAVEGYAIGAGLGIAAACDQVVAAEGARFSASFLAVGLCADLGVTWSLPLRVGRARARSLLLTDTRLDGRHAVEWGLADRLAETGRALDDAVALGTRLAAGPPLAVAALKAMLNHPAAGMHEALDAEFIHQAAMFDSADFAEGLAALREKRRPTFIGR